MIAKPWAASRWQPRLGSSLCSLALVHFGNERSGQHIGARPLARVAYKSVALHVAHDRMGRDRDMNHFGPALRAHRGILF